MELILQSQSTECGLACLAMVASHHGNHVDLRELRARFVVSSKGTNLSQMMSIAQRLGLIARAVRLDMDELASLPMPCILHWDLNHFVVLAGVSRGKATILDPAAGKQTLKLAEVSRHFTGVALEMAPATDFQPRGKSDSVKLFQLIGRVVGLWRSLAMVFALSIALQICVVVAPLFMQWVVDRVIAPRNDELLTILGLAFSLLLVAQVAITWMRGWAVTHLSSQLGVQWTASIFSHLLRLPLDFFEKRHLGDIVSRMGAVQAIQRTLTTSSVAALIDGLMAIVTFAMMLAYSWKLALVSLAAVLVYLLARCLSYGPLRRGTEQQLVSFAKQQSYLFESIRGIQSLKVSGTEVMRQARYFGLMNDTVNRDVWLARLGLGFASLNQFVFGLERIIVIWLAAVLVLSNVLTIGMLIAYLVYKEQFAQRIASLIDKFIEFRMLRLHGERLAEIALTAPEVVHATANVPLPATASLQVQGLSFRYSEADPYIVEDCSFEVADGESVAIVGPSGCGKSTLVKLMLGLLHPEAGTVRVSGHDIRELGIGNYRSMVGAVMQDDRLFAGSVAENIAIGEESVDFSRVEEAARLAAVFDDIASMPMGFHTLIGDMGSSLSSGQRQRVILARALYRQPRILFLDEATSHLDVRRERLVNEAVRNLRLTKIVIAHRRETIASADRILVMREGRLVEAGKPRLLPSGAVTWNDARDV